MIKLLNNIKSFNQIIKQLVFILDKKQKKRSISVFINMVIASVLDTLGVAAILPFITALTDIELVKKQWYTKLYISIFHIQSDTALMISIGLIIILIYVIKNLYLYLYQCILIKYKCSIQKEVSVLMLRSYMSRPYSFFRNTNSSIIMRGIDVDVTSLYNVISSLFLLMSQILTIILVGAFLIRQDVVMAVGIVSASIVCMLLIVLGFKTKSKKAGNIFAASNEERVSASYQIINGIKEIFVMQRRKQFTQKYENAYSKYCSSLIMQNEVDALPIRIIETTFVSFVIGIVCVKLAMGMNPMGYVPQLATFAVAGFRLIPMITAIPTCMNGLIFNKSLLNEAYENVKAAREYSEIMEDEVDYKKELERGSVFSDKIVIKDLSYGYEDGDGNVLDGLSLSIDKGESIGIIGESGAGKSTFVDIIMGLQKPSSGTITVDGENIYAIPHLWSQMVGYIPQTIFLLDDTIRNNILFGLENQDNDDAIWKALKEAQLDTFVTELPKGLDTVVGEQGVRLSGGQRQRIVIARVMYGNPSIIVMDEATSALDNDTEKAVMESIDAMQGDKTLIIVAHRLTTVRNCNHLYELKDGAFFTRKYEDVAL